MSVRVYDLAHSRTGDKGNTSNISVIAYAPALYPYLKEQLTADKFKAHYAGVVTGCMNTFSNLGGVLTPLVVAYAVDRYQSWTFPFYVTALVYAAGAFIWLTIDPTKPISGATLSGSPRRA